MLDAVAGAVESVFERPAGSVTGSFALDDADSIDLIEIAELTEQNLLARGVELRLDDATLVGWPDVSAFAGNAAGQLSVWRATGRRTGSDER